MELWAGNIEPVPPTLQHFPNYPFEKQEAEDGNADTLSPIRRGGKNQKPSKAHERPQRLAGTALPRFYRANGGIGLRKRLLVLPVCQLPSSGTESLGCGCLLLAENSDRLTLFAEFQFSKIFLQRSNGLHNDLQFQMRAIRQNAGRFTFKYGPGRRQTVAQKFIHRHS